MAAAVIALARRTGTGTAGNIASKSLLQKTGFLLEGELRECYWLNGRWHNDWLFGLLPRDYHRPASAAG